MTCCSFFLYAVALVICARKNRAFTLSLISLRRSPDMETAPQFDYLIRQNPLNRITRFLLSDMFNVRRNTA
ncbi:hypothetical protein DFO55_101131 [Grimontella sp. AG753]|nr:hypothetical protein DFO55_101131 [Grimontella sp. AG753]